VILDGSVVSAEKGPNLFLLGNRCQREGGFDMVEHGVGCNPFAAFVGLAMFDFETSHDPSCLKQSSALHRAAGRHGPNI
jgi:hypothetical protein